MNVRLGFLLYLVILGTIAEAAPVIVPMGKVAGGELSAVLPNEQTLQGLLLAQAITIIVFLAKTVWQMFSKKSEATENDLKELKVSVLKIEAELKTLTKLPNEKEILERIEDRIEYMVYKAVKSLEKKH